MFKYTLKILWCEHRKIFDIMHENIKPFLGSISNARKSGFKRFPNISQCVEKCLRRLYIATETFT